MEKQYCLSEPEQAVSSILRVQLIHYTYIVTLYNNVFIPFPCIIDYVIHFFHNVINQM